MNVDEIFEDKELVRAVIRKLIKNLEEETTQNPNIRKYQADSVNSLNEELANLQDRVKECSFLCIDEVTQKDLDIARANFYSLKHSLLRMTELLGEIQATLLLEQKQ
jgi:hypothetical protein